MLVRGFMLRRYVLFVIRGGWGGDGLINYERERRRESVYGRVGIDGMMKSIEKWLTLCARVDLRMIDNIRCHQILYEES